MDFCSGRYTPSKKCPLLSADHRQLIYIIMYEARAFTRHPCPRVLVRVQVSVLRRVHYYCFAVFNHRLPTQKAWARIKMIATVPLGVRSSVGETAPIAGRVVFRVVLARAYWSRGFNLFSFFAEIKRGPFWVFFFFFSSTLINRNLLTANP